MPIKKILPSVFCASLLLTGGVACQPKEDSEKVVTVQRLTPSPEAQAIIQDFKAEYVTRALNQQENQLAASNAMNVADSTEDSNTNQLANDNAKHTNNASSDTDSSSRISSEGANTQPISNAVSNVGSAINIGRDEAVQDDEIEGAEPPQDDFTDLDDTAASNLDTNLESSPELNNDSTSSRATNSDDENVATSDNATQEEIAQIDVQKKAQEEIEAQREAKIEPLPIDELNDPEKHPLPLATIIIPPPEELTAEQLEARYHQAMQDLYLPDDVLLPPQSADTLLSVATLIPDVFKNPELARRLTLKSPAMARLLRQYQVWEQIEAQQSIELAELKVAQREAQEAQKKKFEALMAEFDKTIKGYDEQIAKYEQLLKEFE